MADIMLSDRSWLPEFRRKIFMQNSKWTKYDRRKKKKERLSERLHNRLIKRRDGDEVKYLIHGAQQRLMSVELFDGKIERVWKGEEMKWGSFPNIHMYVYNWM